ncbi:MAG: DegQ family serine endoprotease [Alphaproteobacteria bacterium]|nr:DegQ family serine endoprotease [Alphaproteobacteria bacterium]
MFVGTHSRLHYSSLSSRRPLRALLFGGVASLGLAVAPGLAGAQSPIQAPTAENGHSGNNITAQVQREPAIALPSLSPLVERVAPAVVNISARLNDDSSEAADQPADEGGSQFDDMLRRFFENRGMPRPNHQAMALGSGFIVDPDGYIVTNNHVVSHSDKITVIFKDNSRHPAKVIGRDEKSDLALLKIDTKEKLPFVTWGDSDNVKVGDWVVADGNAFGLGGTVTAGIVSALGRNINEGPYDDFIQIDAPINRGNSGGPTFNLSGEVIGINTAIYSPSGGSVGIGFAIPSATAKGVIEQLKAGGHVTRGWLGVAIQGITPTIARSLGLNPDQPEGALVASVTPDSPAAKAGIKQGDVIVSAGGHPIKAVHDLPRLVANTPVGQKLELKVLRNGKDTTVTAEVVQMPQNLEQVASDQSESPEASTTSLGLQLAAIDARSRQQYRIPKEVEGVVVTKVANDSPAAVLGLQPGDVIQSVDQQPVKGPEQAASALKQASGKGTILLLLNRHGASQFVGLSVTPGVGGGNPG